MEQVLTNLNAQIAPFNLVAYNNLDEPEFDDDIFDDVDFERFDTENDEQIITEGDDEYDEEYDEEENEEDQEYSKVEIFVSNLTTIGLYHSFVADGDGSVVPSYQNNYRNCESMLFPNMRDLHGENVTGLNLSNMDLSSLDLSSLKSLVRLSICNTMIHTLDVNCCLTLRNLYANDSALTILNSDKSYLQKLEAPNCRLKELLMENNKHIRDVCVNKCLELTNVNMNGATRLHNISVRGCAKLVTLCIRFICATDIDLDDTGVRNMDFSCTRIRYLYISNHPYIKTLTFDETCLYLKSLTISRCPLLEHIDISKIPNIKKLVINNKNMTSIIADGNKSIHNININSKMMRALNLSECTNLKHLSVGKTFIRSMSVPPSLTKLSFPSTASPDLSMCLNLGFLKCQFPKYRPHLIFRIYCPKPTRLPYVERSGFRFRNLCQPKLFTQFGVDKITSIQKMARKALIHRHEKKWHSTLCEIDSRPAGTIGEWDAGGINFQDALMECCY